MLIKPTIKNEEIIQCLHDAYGLSIIKVTFLPLGADFNTFVYRVVTDTGISYFLKLRSGEFNTASVMVPKYLADQGIKQVISPLPNNEGQLWTELALFKVILYPYIEGYNGVEVKLSDEQWFEFGSVIKKLHGITLPHELAVTIPQENFSFQSHLVLESFLERVEDEIFEKPVEAEMAAFLRAKSAELFTIIELAQESGGVLEEEFEEESIEYVLCHADLHGWNLLTDAAGALYVVNWDTVMYAPKEQDLMFIGAGISDSGRIPDEEKRLFYKGYGKAVKNSPALAYYRYERIIQDIVEYCEHIFLSDADKEGKMQSFEYVKSIFLSNGPLEIAHSANDIYWRGD
jgi:spectinomycin phosphotransferase